MAVERQGEAGEGWGRGGDRMQFEEDEDRSNLLRLRQRMGGQGTAWLVDVCGEVAVCKPARCI